MTNKELNKSLCGQISDRYLDAMNDARVTAWFCEYSRKWGMTPEQLERELHKKRPKLNKTQLSFVAGLEILFGDILGRVALSAGTFTASFDGKYIFRMKQEHDLLIGANDRVYFYGATKQAPAPPEPIERAVELPEPKTNPEPDDSTQTDAPASVTFTTDARIFLRLNEQKAGIEVSFSHYPGPDVVALLKSAGMFYSFTKKLWFAKDTETNRAKIDKVLTQIEILP